MSEYWLVSEGYRSGPKTRSLIDKSNGIVLESQEKVGGRWITTHKYCERCSELLPAIYITCHECLEAKIDMYEKTLAMFKLRLQAEEAA